MISTIITGIAGAAAGIIIIGAVLIAMGHLGRLPGAAKAIVLRLFMVAAYAGGAAIAVTGLGGLWLSLVTWVAHFFGGLGAGVAYVVVVLAGAAVLLGLFVELIWVPNEAAVLTAALAPFILMLVPGGVLHQFYAASVAPAQALATTFSAWLGGL